ncbi:MAG: phytanoyl-CoA dioxygenase family protein [Bacteroidia bacterium]
MFELSEKEFQERQVNAEKMLAMCDILKEKGYVIIEKVYSQAQIDKWRAELMTLLEAKREKFFALMQAKGSKASGNNGPQRWSMHLPTDSQLFQAELFAEPIVISIAQQIMGDNFVPVFISSEIAYPGTKMQVAHQDASSFALSLMIPLIDVNPENAPTEIWEGTHKKNASAPFDLGYYYVSDAECEQYVEKQQGTLATLKKGDIILRDVRMLHRGTENVGEIARPYLHILYYPIIHRIPPKVVTNFTVPIGKWLRNKIYPLEHTEKMILANYVGQLPELVAYSDRDFRRTISTEQFQKMSPQAQHLLRLADMPNRSRWKGNWLAAAKFLWLFGKTFLRTLW